MILKAFCICSSWSLVTESRTVPCGAKSLWAFNCLLKFKFEESDTSAPKVYDPPLLVIAALMEDDWTKLSWKKLPVELTLVSWFPDEDFLTSRCYWLETVLLKWSLLRQVVFSPPTPSFMVCWLFWEPRVYVRTLYCCLLDGVYEFYFLVRRLMSWDADETLSFRMLGARAIFKFRVDEPEDFSIALGFRIELLCLWNGGGCMCRVSLFVILPHLFEDMLLECLDSISWLWPLDILFLLKSVAVVTDLIWLVEQSFLFFDCNWVLCFGGGAIVLAVWLACIILEDEDPLLVIFKEGRAKYWLLDTTIGSPRWCGSEPESPLSQTG